MPVTKKEVPRFKKNFRGLMTLNKLNPRQQSKKSSFLLIWHNSYHTLFIRCILQSTWSGLSELKSDSCCAQVQLINAERTGSSQSASPEERNFVDQAASFPFNRKQRSQTTTNIVCNASKPWRFLLLCSHETFRSSSIYHIKAGKLSWSILIK